MILWTYWRSLASLLTKQQALFRMILLKAPGPNIMFIMFMVYYSNSTSKKRFGGVSLPTPAAHEMPEMVVLSVELVKDSQGLGITIAGYTCEREELSGIFVKSVTDGSAAHRSGKVAVNDQIIEVDGRSIQGYTNQQVWLLILF